MINGDYSSLKNIYFKNKTLPSLLTKYPSQYVFSKMDYKNVSLEYNDTFEKNSLYIHIPFCSSVCKFCNLYAIKKESSEQIQDYLYQLQWELSLISQKLKGNISHIWIWWWTPNLLSPKQTNDLLKHVFESFDISSDYHLELDVHPLFLWKELLEVYKEYNVQLLSLGVQSFNPEALKHAERSVMSQKILSAKIALINSYGIKVHLDFIVWLPNDSLNFDYKIYDNFFKNLEIYSISVNKYENTFNTDFFRKWYRVWESNVNDKHRAVRDLEAYFLQNFGIRRNQSIFIKSFFRNRYNVIAAWSGAYWYLRWEWVYRNPLLKWYDTWGYWEKKFFKMSLRDEKIMYLYHNWDAHELSFLYKDQFDSYLVEDFPDFFKELKDSLYSFIDEKHVKFSFPGNDFADFILWGLLSKEIKQYYI